MGRLDRILLRACVVMLTLIFILLIVGIAGAGNATLRWDAPTTYSDGTTLPISDIDHFTVYWGTASGVRPNSVNTGKSTNVSLVNLPAGKTIYAVVTATTISLQGGMESDTSNEVSKIIPNVPSSGCGNVRFD
jgi:hypothetical protein